MNFAVHVDYFCMLGKTICESIGGLEQTSIMWWYKQRVQLVNMEETFPIYRHQTHSSPDILLFFSRC